jgi:hypothetical protein
VRVTLRQFIDAVCYLANEELPFRGHEESSTSLNEASFMEFFSVLKNYDPLPENRLNLTTVIQFEIQKSSLI